MLIEEAIYTLLIGNSAVTAIVGERIYPVQMPEVERGNTEYPAVVFFLDEPGRERMQTQDGPSPLVRSPITIRALSKTYFEAKTLADKVRLAINGKSVELEAIYGDHVRGIFLEKEVDEYLFDQVEELTLYSVPQEYSIQHKEEI